MSKTSKARRAAVAQDVERRAWYAFSSGNRENPYPHDDKRHPLFAAKLLSIEATDRDFEEMCDIHGCDTRTWTKRKHQNPGPVRPIEQLVLR